MVVTYFVEHQYPVFMLDLSNFDTGYQYWSCTNKTHLDVNNKITDNAS